MVQIDGKEQPDTNAMADLIEGRVLFEFYYLLSMAIVNITFAKKKVQ